MRSGGRHFRKKGEVTDDTLQAIAVAESLAICGGFNPEDLVMRLVAGYKLRPAWFGPTSSAFFDLVESGTLPHHAARLVHKRRGSSRSNGSVMRGFPIGIFFPAPRVYDVSLTCSRLTHYDPVGGHCSAFLNVMVSDLCRGISRATAFRHARSLCIHPEVRTVLGNYQHYTIVPGLDAVECSHAALSCFMESRSLEHAMLWAINLGGDTDTVGACTGALAGAYWGIDSVPEWWSREVEGHDRLVQLAGQIWEARSDRCGNRR